MKRRGVPLCASIVAVLVAAGVAACGVGVWLLLDPDIGMAGGPRRVADYLPGVGALIAGLVILAFAAWAAFGKHGRR